MLGNQSSIVVTTRDDLVDVFLKLRFSANFSRSFLVQVPLITSPTLFLFKHMVHGLIAALLLLPSACAVWIDWLGILCDL